MSREQVRPPRPLTKVTDTAAVVPPHDLTAPLLTMLDALSPQACRELRRVLHLTLFPAPTAKERREGELACLARLLREHGKARRHRLRAPSWGKQVRGSAACGETLSSARQKTKRGLLGCAISDKAENRRHEGAGQSSAASSTISFAPPVLPRAKPSCAGTAPLGA